MGKGFYHPVVGCWQTINEPSEAIKSGYPSGTVEVPLRPSDLHDWVGGSWRINARRVAERENQQRQIEVAKQRGEAALSNLATSLGISREDLKGAIKAALL